MPTHDTAFLGSKTQMRRQSNAKVEASAEFFSTLLDVRFRTIRRSRHKMPDNRSKRPLPAVMGVGTFQRRFATDDWLSHKHVDDYLAEFTHGTGRRRLEANLFDGLVVATLSCRAVTYKESTTQAT